MNRAAVLEHAARLMGRFGVARTSVEMIAKESGTTRMTLYRTIGDKRAIARAAFLHLLDRYDEAVHRASPDETVDVDAALRSFAREHEALPFSNARDAIRELASVYPDVAREVTEKQQRIGREFFERLLAVLAENNDLNPAVDPSLVQATFETLLGHLHEHPALRIGRRDPGDIFAQVVRLLLYGVLHR